MSGNCTHLWYADKHLEHLQMLYHIGRMTIGSTLESVTSPAHRLLVTVPATIHSVAGLGESKLVLSWKPPL